MTQTLTFGCALYDRTAPLKDGRVSVDGYAIDMKLMAYGAITAAAFDKNELDIAEISTSTLVGKVDQGIRTYAAIPAFLSMCFRHDCIYVRADSRIEKPEDLAGKRIGVPEFYGTTSIWLRGMLADLHGVDFRRVGWMVGPVEGTAGVLKPHHPEGVSCDYLDPGKCLSDLLFAGEIDAIFAHRVPAAFYDGRFRRLYRDIRAAERPSIFRCCMSPRSKAIASRRMLRWVENCSAR
jgi:4,5-dihydroxyphthalate decarboxylase